MTSIDHIALTLGYGPEETPPLPVPVALTLGHDEVRRVGRSRAEHQHPGATPVRLGCALHYRLDKSVGETGEFRKP
ncbi:DUF6177 family protein [Streptomyces sp. NPDC001480]|uniref:DUF6177 family protein n=1 Tax=Streptomyces sp. NPDC001480 TaxID=3364577 RepID=UPI003676A68D